MIGRRRSWGSGWANKKGEGDTPGLAVLTGKSILVSAGQKG